MSEFTWLDDYKIGDASIDKQHQNLFTVANQIIEAKTDGEVSRLLMQFYQHVREHFNDEENLMKRHHYPDYPAHVAAHNLMLDKLNDIGKTVHSKQWTPEDIRIFVNHWVLVHILEVDMQFGQFLKQHSQT